MLEITRPPQCSRRLTREGLFEGLFYSAGKDVRNREIFVVFFLLQAVQLKTNVNEDLYDEVLQTLEILKRLEKPDPPLVTGACNAKARGPFLGAVILACLFQWRAHAKSQFSGHQSRPSAAFLYATSCSKGFRVRIADVACRDSVLLNWNLIHCFQVPSACTTARSSSTDCFPARQTPPTPSGCELSQTVMTGAR